MNPPPKTKILNFITIKCVLQKGEACATQETSCAAEISMEKIGEAEAPWKKSSRRGHAYSVLLTHWRSSVRYAPSCSEARGGVISLDPPPPDTTAEPGGNQIVSDSHPLRMIPAQASSVAQYYSVACLRYAECSRAPDYINVEFLGRWCTYACPQCLSSDTVPIRSWTRTLRLPGIRHRHLPYHTIPTLHYQ